MAVCWDVPRQRMRWVGLLTLAWPLTPYRLHQSLWLDNLNTSLCTLFLGCVFRGCTLDEECTLCSRDRCVLCDCFTKHIARAFFSCSDTHRRTHALSVTHCLHTISKATPDSTVPVSLIARLLQRNLVLS